MKKLYTTPSVEFKEFKVFEDIAASPIPTPPTGLTVDGEDVTNAITSYSLSSPGGINSFVAPSPSPSPTPGA